MIPSIGRRARWAALAVAALTLVAACGGSTGTNNGQTSFKGTKKVGISTALTGQSQLYGHAISQSLQLAADDVNKAGGVNGYKIEMDILDDNTQVTNAVNNVKQLILQDNGQFHLAVDLEFTANGRQATGSRKFDGSYTLNGSDVVFQDAGSAVTGSLQNGTFVAQNGSLSTKCPSKYAPAKKTT